MLFYGSKWNELCQQWKCTAEPPAGGQERVLPLLRATGSAASKRGIAQRMTQRLLSSPYVALHDLRCDYFDGTLTLRGRVPTFHTKQIAISLACDLEGVKAIVDRMEVTEPKPGKAAG